MATVFVEQPLPSPGLLNITQWCVSTVSLDTVCCTKVCTHSILTYCILHNVFKLYNRVQMFEPFQERNQFFFKHQFELINHEILS